ncbi:N-acetylmuramoyl-L-alanine amidase [Amycolatopsis balhimycina DSM 5908]|uniref:N-acetylmuramoyl-L-alanine amidase n=1 Tax=Amycolatopsis balhimycina DSM 5908 TaxID=1081091 RepID=A0A428X4I0_AMYBA|nr:peptidoglycan recognition family protein [Amycolatopsis balhimycina]RSM50245.1 N-acetylmuramoyl-L-alanine amidase [Amycolatopsis balhimycina DSM 5908]
MSRPVPRTAAVAAAVALLAGLATPAYADTSSQRQRDFAAAAGEFGVPENVLLGVSYLESRWDSNAGTPSTSAGYGPMHLTDLRAAGVATSHHDEGSEDPRGDDARPALHPQAGPAVPPPAELQTVDRAAQLLRTDAATLRTDTTQNIRGGAALLAQFQRELGKNSGGDAQDWYGAVTRYSGSTDATAAQTFADEVFDTIAGGVTRTTDDGQQVTLAATAGLTLPQHGGNPAGVECPRRVACESVPAPYQQLPKDDYGNHDLANRPESQKIDHIVIHDTEGYWDSVLKLAQDPTYVSWHYTIRSNDGLIAQHVPAKDVAWHAGNWYVNAKSIGIEHEGFAAKGTWYTEAMYRSSSKLVGYLARKYGIPLDRAHIIGHDNVPGTTPATIKGMHWDPGPYWDWSHYFDLLGAPLGGFGLPGSSLVTIDPDFAKNQPAFTGCDTAGQPCAPRGSEAVVLHSEPSETSPLLKDAGLHPDGSVSTMDVADVGSRVATGQQYAVAEVRGDWTAIWYLGQKGWFPNPRNARVAKPAIGWVVTPKPGLASVPVYGRAYPEPEAYPANVPVQAITPLPYTLSAGQKYSSAGTAGSEYYYAVTFDVSDHVVVKGKLRYVQIQFGHRIAFVKADDVRILPAF